MRTVDPRTHVDSPTWAAAAPAVSVVIATRNRSAYLPELFDALDTQQDAPAFEVLIADDGSTDETWPELERLVATTDMAVRALQLPPSGGPSVPRNTAVAQARGAVLAVTDDDCLPDPGWLAALAGPAAAGHIVQGRTIPVTEGQRGPWDRTISIERLSGLWESCNLALPRQRFVAAGGFPTLDLLGAGGRGFGEDAVLGAAIARTAGGQWAPDAVVRHRWLPGDYSGYLDQMRRLVAMPAVVAAVPELRHRCVAGVFRNRRAAACAAALAAVAVAAATRRPAPALAAAPWLVLLRPAARSRWGRPVPLRIAQEAAADLVALQACARGSVRAKTLVL